MEWTWLTFLISLAALVFGSTCNVLYLIGQQLDTNWCPDQLGTSIALAAAGAAAVLPALVALNEDVRDRTNFSGYFNQFRRCGLTLLWLRSNGELATLFARLAAESAVDLFMSISFVAHGRIKNPFIYALLMKLATIVAFLTAAKANAIGFLSMAVILRLLSWQEPTFADPAGTAKQPRTVLFQVIAPLFSAGVVAYSNSSEAAFGLLTSFELIAIPILLYSVPSQVGVGVVGATVHGTADLAMPSHRAAVVVGAIALVSTAYVGLSPAIVSAYIYSQSPQDLSRLGIIFALTQLAEAAGPSIADKAHKETRSLLKTGLLAFWCSALAITPAMLVYGLQGFKTGTRGGSDPLWYSFGAKELVLSVGCILWSGAFSALVTVENRIVSEWSTAQDPVAEQRAMCAIAIMAASLANVLVMMSSFPDLHAVVAASLFGLICAVLGAAAYTIWFARNDRGPWRLVDGEGRELLRVTG